MILGPRLCTAFLSLNLLSVGSACKKAPPREELTSDDSRRPSKSAEPNVKAADRSATASKGGSDVPTKPTTLPAAVVVPAVTCDTSPNLRWSTEPISAFSCSPMRTSEVAPGLPGVYVDESGAKVAPLDLTLAPGSEFSLSVGVKNDKGVSLSAAALRHETKGMPVGAAVNAASGTFQWTVKGSPGDVVTFTVAVHTKLPEGERCVKQPVVIHLVDNDVTRANQIGQKVRMEHLYRRLACMWAHQGPDLAANAHDDLEDEKALRTKLACGSPLVDVTMRDVDGDGTKDALVAFLDRASKTPGARFETGPSVQVHLRKGLDFTRITEAAGGYFEADDGTVLFLDTDGDQEGAACTSRPYRSTGGPGCGITTVHVYQLTGKTVERIGSHLGAKLPADPSDPTACTHGKIEIEKDGKGKVTGFRTTDGVIPWKKKTPPLPD